MKKETMVHLCAFCTTIVWAGGFAFTKLALEWYTPNEVGLLRYFSATLILIPIVLIKKTKPPALRDLPMFLFSGAMGFFLYMLAFNKGIETLTSATSSIIIATAPIITALLARLLFKEKIRPLGWVAVGVEFSGILILMLWKGVFTMNSGIIWMLLGALLISCYNLTQRKLVGTYTPLQSIAYSIFIGTAMLLIFAPRAYVQVTTAPFHQILTVVFLGAFPSVIGYMLWSKALSAAEKTSTVTNYMFLTPFLSTLLGYIVMMEKPDLGTMVGGAVILSGLFLFTVVAKKGKQEPAAADPNEAAEDAQHESLQQK